MAGKPNASKKRLLNVLTPLRQSCRYATAQVPPLLKVDPLAEFEVQRPERVKDDLIDPFTADEVAAIAAVLDPAEANLITVWAWVGPRQGELFALTWRDVDLERKTARISKSRRGGRLKATKTVNGERTVRLLPPALEALQRQRSLTLLKHREVFLRPGTDEPWGADKPFRIIFKAACERAGVRYRFPRQLRHTFASWMLGSSENPLWVSKHMGHSNPAFTLKVYARLIPDMYPDAGMRAVREISKAG
jgi:integrase